jgi:hypothetical protein
MALLDSPSDVAEVRQQVRILLAVYHADAVIDAVQVADEVMSRAYRHGSPPRDVRLQLRQEGTVFRVEVDADAPRRRDCCADCRYGGLLLDALSTTWGVEEHGDHHLLWADVALVHTADVSSETSA